MIDYYKVLGVQQDAPLEVIKGAYIALCKKYHPDVNGNGDEELRKMQQVNEAYEVLKNKVKRKKYDDEYFSHQNWNAASSKESSVNNERTDDQKRPVTQRQIFNFIGEAKNDYFTYIAFGLIFLVLVNLFSFWVAGLSLGILSFVLFSGKNIQSWVLPAFVVINTLLISQYERSILESLIWVFLVVVSMRILIELYGAIHRKSKRRELNAVFYSVLGVLCFFPNALIQSIFHGGAGLGW